MSDPIPTLAERHGVSVEAAQHLQAAIAAGHGTMAQFNHPELGGPGQWFAGGMLMIGRMFDDGLKARVGALARDLAALPRDEAPAWAPGDWPKDFGPPSSSGGQDGMRYAYFPDTHRLAIRSSAGLAVYDTGDHRISGVSQANGDVRFTSQTGTVDLSRLSRLDGPEPTAAVRTQSSAAAPAPSPAPQRESIDILATIERLAELRQKGVLTEHEFSAKKADLLTRL